MQTVDDLLAYADESGFDVDFFMLNHSASLSVQLPQKCCIAINPLQLNDTADEKMKLAHELGHCSTGAFYNRYSPFDIVGRQEHRANVWAYKRLVPKSELDCVVKSGRTEPWELAEWFGVPERFIRDAIAYYEGR